MATATVYGNGTAYLPLPAFEPESVTLVEAPSGYTVPEYIEQDGHLVVVDTTGRIPNLRGYTPWFVDWGGTAVLWAAGVPYTVTATFTAATDPGTVAIDDTNAAERLALLCAVDQAPELDDDELELALAGSSNGTAYNLYAAAAAAWRIKAGKVAHKYDYRDPSGEFTRDQLFKHCLAMAAQYEAQAGGVTPLATTRSTSGVW
jgi:hypothetical protein